MFEIIPFGRREINLFNKVFDDFGKNFFPAQQAQGGFRTDVSEQDDRFLLEAELPGFGKEDISIDVSEGVLTISAEHKEETEEDKKDYVYRERRYGSYKRSFDLSGIDADAITGEYKNGVLEINLPKEKEEEAKTRKIELN